MLRTSFTVLHLKQQLIEARASVPIEALEFYFVDSHMPDDGLLSTFGIVEGAIIDVEWKEPLELSVVLCTGKAGRQITLVKVPVWRVEQVGKLRARLVADELPKGVAKFSVRELRQALRQANVAENSVVEASVLRQMYVEAIGRRMLKQPVVLKSPGMLERVNDQMSLGDTPFNNGDTMVLGM